MSSKGHFEAKALKRANRKLEEIDKLISQSIDIKKPKKGLWSRLLKRLFGQ